MTVKECQGPSELLAALQEVGSKGESVSQILTTAVEAPRGNTLIIYTVLSDKVAKAAVATKEAKSK